MTDGTVDSEYFYCCKKYVFSWFDKITEEMKDQLTEIWTPQKQVRGLSS